MATIQNTDLLVVARGAATYKATFKELSDSLPHAVDASETAKGVVELATAAETTAGTDDTRAVHPAGLKVELDKKAPLASPALTGTPTAPTAAAGTKTTQVATTAFVDQEVAWTKSGTTLSPKTTGDKALSSDVSFTQAGTSAVARTVASKLSDVVSVKDFGAVGDGVADDTAAIQAAVAANPGKLLLLPAGTYKITGTISQAVSGADAAVTGFIGDGSTQTIIDNQSGGPAFKVDSGIEAVFAYDARFESLQIKSAGSQAGTIGIQLDGCRFASIRNVRILGQGSHGVYAYSTSGDLTDTAQIFIEHTEILNCGGYGIYASTNTSGIQYNWNLYQVRVGNCTLGGVLYESMVNAVIESCGIFYNQNFGLRITRPAGGNFSKIIRVANTEFDDNAGVQLDVDSCINFVSDQLYLVANSASFTKGIVLGAEVTTAVLNQTSPRLGPALTGLTVIEVEAGAADAVVRDTDYTGYAAGNGNMYVDNTAGNILIVDDRANRTAYTGTYTVTVGNLSDATTSPTTVTGHYSVAGKNITVGFRNLNAIDITGFPGSSILTFTLPKPCTAVDVGFVGSAIVTTDSGSANPPIPAVTSGSTKAFMQRLGTADYLTTALLTSGASSVPYFTLSYIID